MSDFELDLRAAEDHLDDDGEGPGRIELGVLDGSTPSAEWRDVVLEDDHALVLDVDGDVNELAADFARDVKEAGGDVVHFRGFLIVTPPALGVDTERL